MGAPMAAMALQLISTTFIAIEVGCRYAAHDSAASSAASIMAPYVRVCVLVVFGRCPAPKWFGLNKVQAKCLEASCC